MTKWLFYEGQFMFRGQKEKNARKNAYMTTFALDSKKVYYMVC